jgi:hypothetical protein
VNQTPQRETLPTPRRGGPAVQDAGRELLLDAERRLESIAYPTLARSLTMAGVQVQAELALADVRGVLRDTGTGHLAFKRRRAQEEQAALGILPVPAQRDGGRRA